MRQAKTSRANELVFGDRGENADAGVPGTDVGQLGKIVMDVAIQKTVAEI